MDPDDLQSYERAVLAWKTTIELNLPRNRHGTTSGVSYRGRVDDSAIPTSLIVPLPLLPRHEPHLLLRGLTAVPATHPQHWNQCTVSAPCFPCKWQFVALTKFSYAHPSITPARPTRADIRAQSEDRLAAALKRPVRTSGRTNSRPLRVGYGFRPGVGGETGAGWRTRSMSKAFSHCHFIFDMSCYL